MALKGGLISWVGGYKVVKKQWVMQCTILLFCVEMVVIDSHNFELAHLKEEENRFQLFDDFLVRYFCDSLLCHWEWSLVGHENTGRSMACLCKDLSFCVLTYIVWLCYPLHSECTNSMIWSTICSA